MRNENNSWQYAGNVSLVSGSILSSASSINRIWLDRSGPSCWDRRRPRLPASSLTNKGYLSLLIKYRWFSSARAGGDGRGPSTIGFD